MNPAAIALYREHGIDLAREPLEIAVCAQHNNGGLAANHWWESVNIRHLFPVGEVNGSHGIYRPGGSALNSGQVGGFRAAEYIARRYAAKSLDAEAFARAAEAAVRTALRWSALRRARRTWREEREELQRRMSRAGAHIRSTGRDSIKPWPRPARSGNAWNPPGARRPRRSAVRPGPPGSSASPISCIWRRSGLP